MALETAQKSIVKGLIRLQDYLVEYSQTKIIKQ